MAAIQLVCNIFKPGDEVLVAFDLYGGTFRLFDFYEQQYGVKFKYVDFLDYEDVEKISHHKQKHYSLNPFQIHK